MSRRAAIILAVAAVVLGVPVTMTAQPLAANAPVAKVGSVTIRYGQIAADPRLDPPQRVKAEQAELDARIADAMLDPILAKHGVSVSPEEVADAAPPVMKRERTIGDSVEVHRRIARAVRRVRAGEDRHAVYVQELSGSALRDAGISAAVSEQSFSGYIAALDSDAAIDHFLQGNTAEKTAQRYHDVTVHAAKVRKVNELVRKYSIEHSLAFDEARERFWTQMFADLGVQILAPEYRLPNFRKDLP